MPVEVDAEQRKRDVVRAAHELIIEGGLNAVSFRNLAKHLNCSTTAISHYFRDKEDIILASYRYSVTRTEGRRAAGAQPERPDLATSLEAILPIGQEHWNDWVIWISFYSSALHDKTLASEQKVRNRRIVKVIGSFLEREHGDADWIADAAATIVALVYGMAIQSMFDPEEWTADTQRKRLRLALQPYLTGPGQHR